MKKDSCYFSHDSNAKDDPKCMLLIDQLGMEGYGIYWMLVEVLREQPDYKCPLNLVPILARRYNTTAEKVKTVINLYGLFEVDDEKTFFSLSLIRRMMPLDELRERRSIAGKMGNETRWNHQRLIANQSQSDSSPIAIGSQSDRKLSLSKVKESKGKESKYSNNKGTPNSSNSPLKGVSLNSISRNIFEEYFKNVYGTDYYWSAKDSGGMSQLLKKLKFSRTQKNLSLDDASMANALKSFLNNIENEWICENFSVSVLASKYNEILSQIYKKVRNGKPNSQEQPTAREIAEQILANYEPNNAG